MIYEYHGPALHLDGKKYTDFLNNFIHRNFPLLTAFGFQQTNNIPFATKRKISSFSKYRNRIAFSLHKPGNDWL